MHTIKVICAGFALLALCGFLGYRVSGTHGAAIGSLAFIPLWIGGTGINLYVGMQHGYSLREELPTQSLVFILPAAIALIALFFFKKSKG